MKKCVHCGGNIEDPKGTPGFMGFCSLKCCYEKTEIEQKQRDLQEAARLTIYKLEREDKNFYQSARWLAARYNALREYGSVCMACGRTPQDGVDIHVDHIKPRSRFPELALDLDNLQILCGDCNYGKGAWDQTDWRGDARRG